MRRIVVVGVVGCAVLGTAVVLARRRPVPTIDGEPDWAPLSLTGPIPDDDVQAGAWVEPDADGGCPLSHPVKANASSRIYHLPGGNFYDRTKAERCYADPASAESDGFRAAKR